jgi:hypothetical protein
MGSDRRSGLPASAQPQPLMSVIVSLDALFPTDHPGAQRDGLILTGWTAGVLHRWLRSATGQWIGVVTILIPPPATAPSRRPISSCPRRHSGPTRRRSRPGPGDGGGHSTR